MPVIAKDKMHMTGKPVELMRELVSVVPIGGRVLDPFMGSASTGVACVDTGRQFTGIEVTQHYYDVSVRRLQGAVLPTVVATEG